MTVSLPEVGRSRKKKEEEAYIQAKDMLSPFWKTELGRTTWW